eukprot:CAMPEP_0172177800 /NCGR_PEP_ID=MMETSP1050-20130122/15665_1 /TAXON_ID=233186 /ORGANISM="Cryptomonas curvata, Strain CCAP979/52" /LENGTH=325 /DNA_ID=CAMNT_0012850415 /DNA_START=102 /DNA_END=1076 /DNA_ORIENTATION=+
MTATAPAHVIGTNHRSVFLDDEDDDDEGFCVPPPPPFKGEKWVEAVYEAFKKKKAVWEREQQEGHTDEALDEWGTAARMGDRHLNPAFELTASGTGDRAWASDRLDAYARSKGAVNATAWLEENVHMADMPTHEDMGGAGAVNATYTPFYALGDEPAGTCFAMAGSMDANTDPWFRVNQDTNTSLNNFEGDWIQKSLEERVQQQLELLDKMTRDDAIYRGAEADRVSDRAGARFSESVAPGGDVAYEDDQFMDDYVTRPASMTFLSRRVTASLGSNKWIDNLDSMPNATWDPVCPNVSWSLRSQGYNSLGRFSAAFAGPPSLPLR